MSYINGIVGPIYDPCGTSNLLGFGCQVWCNLFGAYLNCFGPGIGGSSPWGLSPLFGDCGSYTGLKGPEKQMPSETIKNLVWIPNHINTFIINLDIFQLSQLEIRIT